MTYIFISHRQHDKDIKAAEDIAKWLRNLGIHYYLDVHDNLLQNYTQSNNSLEVVRRVENALDISTHLLGVLSSNSQGSWWIPFEIGQARRKNIKLAHIILDEVKDLPEYMVLSEDLQDIYEITNWVSDHKSGFIKKSMAEDSFLRTNIRGVPRIRLNRAVIKK